MREISELSTNETRIAHYTANPEMLRSDLARLLNQMLVNTFIHGDRDSARQFLIDCFSTYGSFRYPQSEKLSQIMNVPNGLMISNVGRVVLQKRRVAKVREVEKLWPDFDNQEMVVWFNDTTFEELREIQTMSFLDFFNQIEVFVDSKLGYTPVNMVWQ